MSVVMMELQVYPNAYMGIRDFIFGPQREKSGRELPFYPMG